MSLSPYDWAALDRSRSTDGLGLSSWFPTSCTYPSLTVTWRLEGTTYILPASSGVWSPAVTTGKLLLRSSMEAGLLGRCGSRCCASTIGAGKFLGKVAT